MSEFASRSAPQLMFSPNFPTSLAGAAAITRRASERVSESVCQSVTGASRAPPLRLHFIFLQIKAIKRRAL